MSIFDQLGQQKFVSPQEPCRNRRRERIRRVKFWLYLNVYCRWFYRSHMKAAHRFGWCRMKHYTPYSPDHKEFWRCEWCGMHGYRVNSIYEAIRK